MSKIKNAGDYDLLTVGIVVNKKNFIDISSIFFDITIYESLFDPSISGIITVFDSNDLRKNYSLMGGEEIIIQFSTSGNENETLIRGIIYKYSPYEESGNNISYNIYFYSKELDNSLRKFCVEGYEDTTSNIVKKVFDGIKYNKEIIVEDTIGIYKFVCPRIRPFEVIKKLSINSFSKEKNAGYIFYEDKDNWNFTTLEKLYKQDPISEFYYKPNLAFVDINNRTSESFQTIQNINILSDDSYFNRLIDGKKGTVQHYYDFINKKNYKNEYSRKTEFDKSKSLGNTILDTEVKNTNFIFKVGTSALTEQNNYKNKLALLNLDSFSANIGIFGDNDLTVGKCINAFLPPKISNSVSDHSYSGKFLITAIKHVLNKKTYTQVLTINKDAAEE